MKALLLIDNAPSHPSELELITDDGNLMAMLMPIIITFLIQLMDQNVTKIKKLYYRNNLLASVAANKSDLLVSMSNLALNYAITFLETAWNRVSTNYVCNCVK